jgi:PTH1 family peptidyl-tRNA hydrolase
MRRFGSLFSKDVTGTPFLLVGLGNPGREYRLTRHNIGFMAVDRLAESLGVTFSRMQSQALMTQISKDGNRLILAKPQTYMNLSGQAVSALLKFYKIPLERLLVMHDDLDLPLGTLRLRPSGGSAGQRGLASIIERLGTQEFPRLRMGIGRPPGQMDAADYVLQSFSTSDQIIVKAVLDTAVEACLAFVHDGLDAAMNRFNGSLA